MSLYNVNTVSATITVHRVGNDGTLTLVDDEPSGGLFPSLALRSPATAH